MSQNSSNGGGIGFVGMLTILFIGLKLTGNVAWSWWWVLSPIWIMVLVVVLILIGTFIFAVIAVKSEAKSRRR